MWHRWFGGRRITHPVTPDDGLISYLKLKIRDEKSGDHEDM